MDGPLPGLRILDYPDSGSRYYWYFHTTMLLSGKLMRFGILLLIPLVVGCNKTETTEPPEPPPVVDWRPFYQRERSILFSEDFSDTSEIVWTIDTLPLEPPESGMVPSDWHTGPGVQNGRLFIGQYDAKFDNKQVGEDVEQTNSYGFELRSTRGFDAWTELPAIDEDVGMYGIEVFFSVVEPVEEVGEVMNININGRQIEVTEQGHWRDLDPEMHELSYARLDILVSSSGGIIQTVKNFEEVFGLVTASPSVDSINRITFSARDRIVETTNFPRVMSSYAVMVEYIEIYQFE